MGGTQSPAAGGGATPSEQHRVEELAGIDDEELVLRVRRGDLSAFGTLFERYRPMATNTARRFVDGPTADDAVAEVFVKLLRLCLAGNGPSRGFRPYLLRAVRNAAIDSRRRRRETPVDAADPESAIGARIPTADDPADLVVTDATAHEALGRLPPRWRQVLWLSEVEGYDRHEIGRAMDLRPDAVSALALRAREGLRQAYLAASAETARTAECTRVIDLMPAYVRGRSSRKDARIVKDHVENCRECTRALLVLRGMNARLPALVTAAVLTAAGLGPVAPGSLAAALSGSAGPSGAVAALAGSPTGMVLAAVVATLAAAVIRVAATGGTEPDPGPGGPPATVRTIVPPAPDRRPAHRPPSKASEVAPRVGARAVLGHSPVRPDPGAAPPGPEDPPSTGASGPVPAAPSPAVPSPAVPSPAVPLRSSPPCLPCRRRC